GDDVAVAGALHLGGVGVEHRGVVGARILGEDLMQFGAGLIAVGRAGLFGHLDAAVGHKGALERLVGLQADDLLKVLEAFVNVAVAVGGQAGANLGINIQHAAHGSFFFQEFLQRAQNLVGGVGQAGEEGFVAAIRAIVYLDEVADVDLFFPDAAFKAIPLGIV